VVNAPRAILATGLVDTRPQIDGLEPGAEGSLVRYCPICDGYEAIDKAIGIFGDMPDACGKAFFLRTFSKSVTLLSQNDCAGYENCNELADAGIRIMGNVTGLREEAGQILASSADGSELRFDLLYPILGCNVRSQLATGLGARHTDDRCLIVDEHLQTTVAGLYAVGDIVSDLHQIAVATGHAAVAATHIHKGLPRNFR
jgi:thioredoxin reductase (NADPH)